MLKRFLILLIVVIIIISITRSLIVKIYCNCLLSKEQEIKETKAKILKIGPNIVKYCFYVDGREIVDSFNFPTRRGTSLIEGEMYTILYSEKDPNCNDLKR